MVVAAPRAGADPARPTNYRSRVVAITPETDALTARIVGGDSFIELRVARGHEVVVTGYRGEPYLHFRSDGHVEENQHAPSTFLNRNRFGDVSVPADATADASPEWKVVADDGQWAWHDHRTHWMGVDPPIGLAAGDRILDGIVPITADGHDVQIHVVATWMPLPTQWPALLGVSIVVVSGWVVARRFGVRRASAGALLVVGAAAVTVGGWEFLGLPGATGPSPLWFALPIATVLITGWGWRRERLLRETPVLVAAAALAVWAVLRAPGLWLAVLPTSAPNGLDRAVTAGALVCASAVLGAGLVELGRALAAPQGSSTRSDAQKLSR